MDWTSVKMAVWTGLMVACLPCLLTAQRVSSQWPSPADPGGVLLRPYVVPQKPSPDEGEEPDEEGDDPESPARDERDHPYKPTAPTDPIASVTGWEMSRISQGSVIGSPGDYALVLSGEGFVVGESSPTVHLGEVHLTQAFVSRDSKELYVILPADVIAELPGMDFQRIAVQNPGGRNRDAARWAWYPATSAQLSQAMQSAAKTIFMRSDYHLRRLRY